MAKSDTQFKPGQSGNPKGRVKGSHNKLTKEFIDRLYEDFKKYGQEVLEKVRENDTAAYVRMIASLMPKDHRISGHITQNHYLISVSEALERIGELTERLGEDTDIQGSRPH